MVVMFVTFAVFPKISAEVADHKRVSKSKRYTLEL